MPKSRPPPVFTEPAPAGSKPGGRLYVPTLAGFLYLAIVLDVFSRRFSAFAGTGWSMAGHLRTELVLDALDMAVEQRRPDSVIPTKGASTPPSPSASAAGDEGWSRRWARSGTASTTPWPRASSRPSNASGPTARTSTTPGQAGGRLITERAEPSSSSSRDGTTRIVVTRTSVNTPRWPLRGATRKRHETQALHCPLNRGNSDSNCQRRTGLSRIVTARAGASKSSACSAPARCGR